MSVPIVYMGIRVEHVGIVTDRFVGGERTVISGSKRHGKVVEETLTTFREGKKAKVVGYPGRLDPATVVARARRALGRKWELTRRNCEHFVREVHGLVPASPQLVGGVVIVVGLLALAAVVVAARR